MKRRRVVWIVAGAFALALIAFFVFALQAPLPNYKFLSKYPIAAQGTANDGRRYVILKGEFQNVSSDVQAELASKAQAVTSGWSVDFENGESVKSGNTTISLPDSQVTITSDIHDAHLPPASPEIATAPTQYCVAIFTRSKTLCDRMMSWLQSVFGFRKPIEAAPKPLRSVPSRQGYL